MKTEVGRGCSQFSCCNPGFWNSQYISLLNLTFTTRTKSIAFADGFTLAISKTVSKEETITNLEMSKITAWAESNKFIFS
jgi:hypothetical protein